METREKILELARERLEEAELLLNAGKTAGAFYLAGLHVKIDAYKSMAPENMQMCSLLFGKWSEASRYDACDDINWAEVNNLIEFLNSANGLLQWVQQQ